MLKKNLLFICGAGLLLAAATSCTKSSSSSSPDEVAVTTQSGQDIALSDDISEDANNSVMVAAGNEGLLARPAEIETPNPILCGAAITVSGSFPAENININFGTGLPCPDSLTRSGQINVVLSNKLRDSGSIATVTFTNYSVNGYQRNGYITWTNTTANGIPSWTRVDSGRVTAPSGRYWTVTGTKYVTQTGGISTPLISSDDTFSITGTRIYTDSAGEQRTVTVVPQFPLQKANSCPFIDEGELKIQGPSHYLIINYGNGSCDELATYSLDGGTAIPFFLR